MGNCAHTRSHGAYPGATTGREKQADSSTGAVMGAEPWLPRIAWPHDCRYLAAKCESAGRINLSRGAVKFAQVRLAAPAGRLHELADFYADELGIDVVMRGADRLSSAIGETTIEFVAGSGRPFYHVALLVPGNRFDAALEWAGARTELLPDPESGDVLFDFDNWTAHACYFRDPADNIVELIAHRGIDETEAQGAFSPRELVGLSELGLVGDRLAMARQLAEQLGLALWDGTVEESGRLAFVGEPARTFILAPPGRGWLPTGRAAELHPVEALIAGRKNAEVELEDSRYRIRSIAAGSTEQSIYDGA
jgi:catechol 2,3-dioxygenase-like lactoylglutathione lyase family enzyme